MWIPLFFGLPAPTDAMLTTIGASVPVFFLALAVAAAPALSPARLIRGRFSVASALPAFLLMIVVEYQTLAWLGVRETSRPTNLSVWLLAGMVLIMIGTTWTILAAGWRVQKHASAPAPLAHKGS
jgi:hypothetical protein